MQAAVIGAGWSGCAAAVTLARLGHGVTVFETAAVAGGRARRVVRAGLPIDNGQHLLLGAYVQTRNVMAVVNGGIGEAGVVRAPLAIEPLAMFAGAISLRARRLPSPFGLLAGLLSAQGLTVAERFRVANWFRRLGARDFRCPPGMTVAQLVADGPAVATRAIWSPLCLAALNTPVDHASAQVFANVLQAAFTGDANASDFVFPTTDLSALFPDAALRYVVDRGGRAALRTRATVLEAGERGVTIDNGSSCETFDGAVVAVGPHQIEATLPPAAFAEARSAAHAQTFEPIATAWLGYATRTPLPGRIARLDDAPGQWIVERSDVLGRATPDASRPALAQLVAVIISASGPHDALTPGALAAACDAQVRRLVPGWPPLAWSQTIVEHRATHASTPGRRVPGTTLHSRVCLAGDWVDAQFPATIEAAVRTGVAAAVALDEQRTAIALPPG